MRLLSLSRPVEKGGAYVVDGDVYLMSKIDDYGILGSQTIENLTMVSGRNK